jgi:hypothetical protein
MSASCCLLSIMVLRGRIVVDFFINKALSKDEIVDE